MHINCSNEWNTKTERKMVNFTIICSTYLSHFFQNRFFNDQEIKNTSKTKVESKQNMHTLTLTKCELMDQGTYKCIATNPDGTIETKANLSVCSMFTQQNMNICLLTLFCFL